LIDTKYLSILLMINFYWKYNW